MLDLEGSVPNSTVDRASHNLFRGLAWKPVTFVSGLLIAAVTNHLPQPLLF